MPLAVTVMVPNSLGPAELLIHYGTPAQRNNWLPRLARGQEMPCFALTEPEAGSDAGAMRAQGEVFAGDDGKLYLKLNWDKRYITLAGVSTVLGLAFKLRDPGNLLGKGVSPGITCALIPTATPGVDVSRRHDPLGTPFYNCPTTGHDVVVPVDAIIGGVEGAGRGWQMLMECLAAGRGISLPALATGSTKLAARVASAHAMTRRQFGMAIGKFEGIEEPLARITGTAYMLEAARRFTCGGLDAGVKPPVVTAMCKYQFTELARSAVNDAMDILGGAAISKGPRNLLAHTYTAMPVCITVEGANILTRTLMVFGQGAIRCHPFAFHEIDALGKDDLVQFDRAFWGHIGHVVRNACRATVLTLSRGMLARSPVRGPAARYYKRLAWASASFAFWADVAMGALGGDLKRREKVTGRFADIFSWMYLASATLRRFVDEGQREEDFALLRWSMCLAFDRMQTAFDGLFANLPVPLVPTLLRGPVAWWSRLNRFSEPPTDTRTSEVAHIAQRPGPQRDAITAGIFMPQSAHEHLTRLEEAFVLAFRADDVARKIKAAMRNGRLPRGKVESVIDQALVEGILTPEEADVITRADQARREVCQVDSFTREEYFGTGKRERRQEPQPVG
jgi:acyl-CoA dehydrogenase